MKKISKGNYVRIEGKKAYAQAEFNDDGIIYVDYGGLPFKEGDAGVTERIGHLLNNPEKEYPKSVWDLSKILRGLVKQLDAYY